MKKASDIIDEWLQGEPELTDGQYHHMKLAINQARVEALNEACNVVKIYKVGNGGSWMDAAVDRSPIIELIKQCQ